MNAGFFQVLLVMRCLSWYFLMDTVGYNIVIPLGTDDVVRKCMGKISWCRLLIQKNSFTPTGIHYGKVPAEWGVGWYWDGSISTFSLHERLVDSHSLDDYDQEYPYSTTQDSKFLIRVCK